MGVIKRFLCWIDWHAPGERIYEGQWTSRCRRCGSHIIQDSHGTWFRVAADQE